MNQLYQAYSAMIVNTAYRILNDRMGAEDVMQETFVQAFSRLEQYDERASFGAWLRRISVNKSIDLLRKKKRSGYTEDLDDLVEKSIFETNLESISTHVEEEQLDLIYHAIQKLPDGYRTIFSLYVLEGYDHEEIAHILNVKVSTSISQLSRAKKKIRAMLKKEYHG